MAPRIPEGFTFVPRRSGVNVAELLLQAAEEVGADRVLSVRTTTNGYNVHADVAERYLENEGEEAAEGVIDGPAPEEVQIPGDITEQDLIDGLTSWGDQQVEDVQIPGEEVEDEEVDESNGEPVTPIESGAPVTPVEPATPVTGDSGTPVEEPAPVTGDSGAPAEEPAPLGVTAENTNAEIDDYASKLTPPVDVSKAKNKGEKIEILEHARTAPKSDAE